MKVDAAFRRTGGSAPVTLTHYRRIGGIKKTYAIFITPRSGSTWLTHEIASLNVLGCPEEYFNVDNLPQALECNPARNLVDLFDYVADKMSTKQGLFGFQISYFDLQEVENDISLLTLMEGEPSFIYLTRKNFVEQGLSLYAATATGQFHEIGPSEHRTRSQLETPIYDAKNIRFWISHILQQEFGFQTWLRKHGIKALPLHYESLLQGISKSIYDIADHIGYEGSLPERDSNFLTTHKLCRPGLTEMETLFRNHEAEFCAYWEVNRGKLPCLL